MNKTTKSWAALLVIIVLVGLSMLYRLVPSGEDIDVDNRKALSLYVFSRIVANDIRSFKDTSMIHGPNYFYFRSSAEDISRLKKWLQLQRQDEIPQVFLSSITYVKQQVEWPFDWGDFSVFVNYYCAGNLVDWSFDLLLVDASSRVVYVTSGFVGDLSKPTKDFRLCEQR